MRKILSILMVWAVCLPLMAGIHSYTEESVLASGRWVKIRVSESGVCRMTFSQLEDAGLNPNEVRVYGYGGAMLNQDFRNAKIDDLPQVPVYRGSNFILFWVQGPISWRYNGTRFAHTRNTYSNYGYYLLSDDAGEKMDFPEDASVLGTPIEITTYPYYQVHEKDSLNLIDRSGLSGGGREFYGEQFSANTSRTFSFSTPNAIEGETGQIYCDVAAFARTSSYFVINFDGKSTSTYVRAVDDNYTMGCTAATTLTAPLKADQQQVKLTYQNSTSGSLGWLNHIELTAPSALRMTGSWMPIRTTEGYKTTTPVRFHLADAEEGFEVWDVTQLDAICRIPATLRNDTLLWTGSQLDNIHEYVAVNPKGSKWVSAYVVGDVKNQNLHKLRNIDYTIICPEGYEAISTQLAKAHEQKEGITWAVVTDQQIYNEFSSGTPDATAYRWLMKMLYDRAIRESLPRPRWLLLMGHGTFDNRKLLPNSGTALLLTYQARNSVNEVNAYETDDYFGFLDDTDGDSDVTPRLRLGIGRLPVNNLDEARQTVEKIIRYMQNESPSKWKNQILYLADDGENGTHTETTEISAERIRINNPDFVVNKIFLDAYPQEVNVSGESYPLAKNRLDNMLKNGVLFFDYSGHGGYNAITNESILTLKDIDGMTNKNLGFWLFATCNFAQFDGGRRCAAEVAILNPNGGAVSILAATRTVYASPNNDLNRCVSDTLFGHTSPLGYNTTIGEAIAAGKNNLQSVLGRDGANKLPYVLLGDPALRLNYPTDYMVETSTKIDTLNALSIQHVEGRIVDEDEQLITDFNGNVDITIYDKIQDIPTYDNDNSGDDQRVVYYKDYPNVLFSGTAAVKEGLFEYTFMVPKDIRYNYGNGRIVYYARTLDSLERAEAVGHFQEFTIGGTGTTLAVDTTGPDMRIYLNTPAFKDGDKTYATPRFFAELSDTSGINTAGAGIGHDLMLVVDDDANMTYSLNDYFSSSHNSFRSGMVSYLMEPLPDGPHSLTFRAWDLLNNSSTQSLNFYVQAGKDPAICSVVTYPNPVRVSGTVNLVVNYDEPDALLQTEVYLYSPSGQMLWSHTQGNPDAVVLNLSQLGLQAGVYIYSVRIKSATSGYSTSSGKIIVTQ